MRKATVRDIMKQINQLSPKQRDALERRMAEKRDRELEEELAEARKQAKRDGIDQAAIDRAVMEVRYGK